MFKFRFGGQGGSSPAQAPTIEAVRRRARHRLIGAFVLVVAGVIGFPLLFESQPRPVPANFEIDIPAKNTARPLGQPSAGPAVSGVRVEGLDSDEEVMAQAPARTPASAASRPAAPAVAAPVAQAVPATKPDASARQEPVVPHAEPAPAVAKAVAKPEAKVAERKPPEPRAAAKPVDKPVSEAVRAQALLEDKPAPREPHKEAQPAGKERIIVQVGAFADPDRAHETRQKLERAGLSTYAHVADTPDGKRTRVRVGPFSSRAEADKAAAKVKALGLPAAVLTL